MAIGRAHVDRMLRPVHRWIWGDTDRRVRKHARAPLLGTDYGAGWLCFESGTDRRRHAPIPADWSTWDDGRLEACCRQAVRVVRRLAG